MLALSSVALPQAGLQLDLAFPFLGGEGPRASELELPLQNPAVGVRGSNSRNALPHGSRSCESKTKAPGLGSPEASLLGLQTATSSCCHLAFPLSTHLEWGWGGQGQTDLVSFLLL